MIKVGDGMTRHGQKDRDMAGGEGFMMAEDPPAVGSASPAPLAPR